MVHDATNWDHCLEHAAFTDIGLRRANNQDAMAVVIASSQQKWQQRGHFFLVADGMGAHAAGELASKLAADFVPLTYHKQLDCPAPQALLSAVQDANGQIHARGQASDDFKGMGTTVSALALLPQGALLAHVGDSRAYRLRENRLQQLTFDHSLVWELRAAKGVSEDQVPEYVPRNIITRSLGPNPTVKVDLEGPFPVRTGDTFLLCSDGLSGQVKDEEIGVVLRYLPPTEAVRALVDLANLRGGPDNITVIVVRITGPQVASGASGPPDTSANVPVPGRPVHPFLWTILGVLTLAAGGLAGMGYAIPALVAMAGAVVALLVALIQRYGGVGEESEFDGRLLGGGPYSDSDCTAEDQFADRLAKMVTQLRDAAVNEDWTLDWSRFNGLTAQAVAAAEAADYPQAIRQHLLAISFMVQQLKEQRRQNQSDDSSAVDLS